MTTTIKTRMITIKTVLCLLVMHVGFVCSNVHATTPKANVKAQTPVIQAKSAETITINGTVKAIRFGKDGYTADVQPNDGTGIYAALVSISNVGGPDKHKSCEVGDNVTFTGELSVSGKVKRLLVREIISITAIIDGIVKAITFGKDGYIAEVKTYTKGTYSALVSSANLDGGPDKYQSCIVGNKVSFKGVPSISRTAKSLMVKEIIEIGLPQSVWTLAAEYREMQTTDFYTCWQTNKSMNLHTKPSADSKVEGTHYAGENLQVLKTKIVGNQLWVKVKYFYTIKMGYEHQFADGQITRGGAIIGWIGGAEAPEIRCK